MSECRGNNTIPYHGRRKPNKESSYTILSIYLLYHIHDERFTLVVRVGNLNPGLDDINGVRQTPA